MTQNETANRGGYNNWEWYGEALEDIDVKKEAFNQFVNRK